MSVRAGRRLLVLNIIWFPQTRYIPWTAFVAGAALVIKKWEDTLLSCINRRYLWLQFPSAYRNSCDVTPMSRWQRYISVTREEKRRGETR